MKIKCLSSPGDKEVPSLDSSCQRHTHHTAGPGEGRGRWDPAAQTAHNAGCHADGPSVCGAAERTHCSGGGRPGLRLFLGDTLKHLPASGGLGTAAAASAGVSTAQGPRGLGPHCSLPTRACGCQPGTRGVCARTHAQTHRHTVTAGNARTHTQRHMVSRHTCTHTHGNTAGTHTHRHIGNSRHTRPPGTHAHGRAGRCTAYGQGPRNSTSVS